LNLLFFDLVFCLSLVSVGVTCFGCLVGLIGWVKD
jgi:hypothetical protein